MNADLRARARNTADAEAVSVAYLWRSEGQANGEV